MQKIGDINFCEYDTVFCDSSQALEWAYANGLPKSSIVKTSSPAMLWNNDKNIQNIEKRWNVKEAEIFQGTIKGLTEDIFDAALTVQGMERECALAISQSSIVFQQVLYKAACLEENDFTDRRLFIYVNGKTGSADNMMNSPWDKLLSCNQLFHRENYTLHHDKWDVLTTQEVSYWQRFKVAGVDTLLYRVAIRLMKQLPYWAFKRRLFMPNENELTIEVAAFLMLQGVQVIELKAEPIEEDRLDVNSIFEDLYTEVLPIMQKRVEKFVTPSAVRPTILLFKESIQKQFEQFHQLTRGWDKVLQANKKVKQAVLVNSPGNLKGQALSYVCRRIGVPIIAAQHGVTVEISKYHDGLNAVFDNSTVDAVLAYNSKSAEVENNSHFSRAKQYVIGASSRHIRMKDNQTVDQSAPPIVYISTNLYRGNVGYFISTKTDYSRARDEQKIVTEVLGKISHRVRYKTYPEETRRYSDIDPVLKSVKDLCNVELFSKKVDMRYLLSDHRVIVTAKATSTLMWPVMTGKPVVFINWKHSSPLTDESCSPLSRGMFLFDENDDNFHDNLRHFLSQPIEEIERLWEEKKNFRQEMIKEYFSAYSGGAAKRAAQILLRDYLN